MNQSIAYLEFDALTDHQAHQQESLLEKICDRIGKALHSSRRAIDTRHQPATFIEANLLDEVMGPEISRTLRI